MIRRWGRLWLLAVLVLGGCQGPASPDPTVPSVDQDETAAAVAVPATAKDVTYKGNQRLDLYAGVGSGPRPLIVWVHGGGWQSGDKSQCLPVRLGFPDHGYSVACVNYRLSAVAPFPAQIEDVRDAIAFLRTNAGRYGVDPRRFVAWGSSAGGHLVSLAGTTSGSAIFTADAVGSAVQAVVDFYGPIDLTAMATTPGYTSHSRADSAESRLLGGPVLEQSDAARRANPVSYVDGGDPPCLIVHGSADPVVPPAQSQLFHDALLAAGVTVELRVIPGAKHGGPEFSAPDTVDLVIGFLAAHLATS
jgi:acetyl esterase/lipase